MASPSPRSSLRHRVLDILDAAAGKNESIWEDKAVAVAEFAIEGEPGEDLGQIFRGKIVEYAAVDEFAENQSIVVENLGEHVGLLGRIAAMQIAESMQDIADAADDVAQPFLFEVDLPAELFFMARRSLSRRSTCAR